MRCRDVPAGPPPGSPETAESALEWAAGRVGDRWTLLIVNALLAGPLRFGELAEALPGIATNVLSQRLKRLEADRLVVSTAYSARPPRFSYELTQAGRELGGVLALLAHWGAVAGGGEGVRHSRLRHAARGRGGGARPATAPSTTPTTKASSASC